MPLDPCRCGGCDSRVYPTAFPPRQNPKGTAHPQAARQPPFGSVSKITRVGQNCVRLVERGQWFTVQLLGPQGELLQLHRVSGYGDALTVFAALAGDEAIPR